MNRKGQAGAGKIKGILLLLAVITAIYLAVKIIPAYTNNYALQDAITSETRFALAQHKSIEAVRDTIEKKIKELEIPAKREDIRITDTGSGMRIAVPYTVLVELPGYTLRLNFEPNSDEKRVL